MEIQELTSSRLQTNEYKNGEDVLTQLLDIIENKQDKLIAGRNISIENETINATFSDFYDLIQAGTSADNKLTNVNFVNSSIATNTATFRGTFESKSALDAYAGPKTNNDYAFVISNDEAGNTVYIRYKYVDIEDTASWGYEYTLNNSSFTAEQWATINSGITANKVAEIDNKIDKIENTTVVRKVYTETRGETVLTNAVNASDSTTIPLRDATGNFKVRTPTDDNHCATKNYVDTEITALKARIEALEEILL